MNVGLRIDVDTVRGTRLGVPNLLQLLAGHGISASFFFSVGPDNMGRHLWRLARFSFLRKMLRSKAPSLYGWDILLKGTLWPGPVIGEKLGRIMRSASDSGHEAGLHAWDHHAWQTHIDKMNTGDIRLTLENGFQMLARILDHPPACSAVPGWKCNDFTLREKAWFPFAYNSDCRGESLFFPVVDGTVLSQPQIPVTLPTYDEVIGRNRITDSRYNEYLFTLLKPEALNVLTIHAEVEGVARFAMFERFLTMAGSRGVSFVPLGTFLEGPTRIGQAAIVKRTIPGREGWVSCQSGVEAQEGAGAGS